MDSQVQESYVERAAGRGRDLHALVGQSPALVRLRRWITAVAPLDSHVLLTGETGTGKGLVARLLHERSRRANAPWVHVDCAALAPNVIESELFGHERGAFTGAERARRGCFEAAADGTLFLDEVAELELPLQAKLLRVLQDRQFERVGGRVTLAVRARVITATNRDLEREVRNGRFREDLFYRLHVASYCLPPLRERIEDLPLLAAHQLRRLAARRGAPVATRLDPQALRQLAEHSWPGNVRELANVLERWAILQTLGDGVDYAMEHVLRGAFSARAPAPAFAASPRRPPSVSRSESERDRLLAVLASAGGNVARAARRLAMPRSTLRYRIERYQLRDALPRD